MAKFEVEGIDNLMKELNEIEIRRIASLMLEEAIPILEKSVVKEASKHSDTGEMVRSIKKTGAVRTKKGYYACVRPTGKDHKGVRNMEKMAYLEYGAGAKQPATPALTPAVKNAEIPVLKKMQEVFEREVKA